MKRSKILFFALVIGAGICTQQTFAASFNCSQASHAIEIAICGNPELSALDDKLGAAYKRAIELSSDSGASLKDAQKSWIVRSRQCPTVSCLKTVILERTAELEALAPSQPKSLETMAEKPIQTAPSVPIESSTTSQQVPQGLTPVSAASSPSEQSVEQSVPPVAVAASEPVVAVSQPVAVASQAAVSQNETEVLESPASTLEGIAKMIISFLIPLIGVAIPLVLGKSAKPSNQAA